MTHVHTVYCPECKRMWTGEFDSPVPETAVCKDCVKALKMPTSDHKDIHIRSGRA